MELHSPSRSTRIAGLGGATMPGILVERAICMHGHVSLWFLTFARGRMLPIWHYQV